MADDEAVSLRDPYPKLPFTPLSKALLGDIELPTTDWTSALTPTLRAHLRTALPHLRVAAMPRTAPAEQLGDESGFGGHPWLPFGHVHPACSRCARPMTLFVQLRLSDLPEASRPRGEGMLQVFLCTSFVPDCADDPADFPTSIVRLVPHASGGPSSAGVAFPVRRILEWTQWPLLPLTEELRERFGVRLGERTDQWLWDVGAEPDWHDQVGGWPGWIQSPTWWRECPDCGGPIEFALQIRSTEHVPYMFGDNGLAHLYQCVNDPAHFAFDWECF